MSGQGLDEDEYEMENPGECQHVARLQHIYEELIRLQSSASLSVSSLVKKYERLFGQFLCIDENKLDN